MLSLQVYIAFQIILIMIQNKTNNRLLSSNNLILHKKLSQKLKVSIMFHHRLQNLFLNRLLKILSVKLMINLIFQIQLMGKKMNRKPKKNRKILK